MRKPNRGLSLVEVLVVISIIVSLSLIGMSGYQSYRLGLQEAECRLQLQEIGNAWEKYQEDHAGQDPPSLTRLVPKYLDAKYLVCPYTRTRAPAAVQRAEELKSRTVFKHFCSYFAFSRRGLDRLRDEAPPYLGYSDVLRMRGGDTPVAACYDHREPFSLHQYRMLSPEFAVSWSLPERPILVLRRSGRVDPSRYGGLRTDWRGMVDTMADLQNL